MKKQLSLLALVLVFVLALSACGCKHETWNEANCETPKTCAECGETEGEALGHVWMAATCETAKTCETCGKTDGEALGHAWVEATCETAKTCSTCSKTEGEVPGHTWVEATTEAPKTCTTCAKTEGEKVITDARFTTAATRDVQGVWAMEIEASGEQAEEMMQMPGLDAAMKMRVLLELNHDATMKLSFSIVDEEAFKTAMTTYMVEALYAEFEAQGINKEEADAAMVEAYGMGMADYAATLMNSMNLNDLLSAANVNGVYYVENSKLYIGMDWKLMEDEGTEFTVSGDTLTLKDDVAGTGAEESVFTRVPQE